MSAARDPERNPATLRVIAMAAVLLCTAIAVWIITWQPTVLRGPPPAPADISKAEEVGRLCAAAGQSEDVCAATCLEEYTFEDWETGWDLERVCRRAAVTRGRLGP